MNIHFYKYHGAGNDFILLDNRKNPVTLSKKQVALLCHRHYGIGADGLMLLENAAGYDFRMVYYNSDGGESTMCGNGGRCITAFAHNLGLIADTTTFIAIDGPHNASIRPDGTISLQMQEVSGIQHYDTYAILNTGSPHYILWTDDTDQADVFREGRRLRNLPEFQPGGININFVQQVEGGLKVRTYERGVEDETLSCGTGVTAAAIAATKDATGNFAIPVSTPGGRLEISFTKDTPSTAKNVILKGPAVFVFEGDIDI